MTKTEIKNLKTSSKSLDEICQQLFIKFLQLFEKSFALVSWSLKEAMTVTVCSFFGLYC